MNVAGSTAFVTGGANRGIGRAFASALLEGGAKVYAAVRDPATVSDPDLFPVRCDVTDRESVEAAAAICADTQIVVSNAGVAGGERVLKASFERARAEVETNYLGTLSLGQAFAPVLASNGGGAFVSVLSVASWLAQEQAATYAASKAAQWSITNALRIAMRAQGTLVTGVHCGFVATDLTAGIEGDKLQPGDVAAAALRGLVEGREEVLVDELSRQVKASLSKDLELLYGSVDAAARSDGAGA